MARGISQFYLHTPRTSAKTDDKLNVTTQVKKCHLMWHSKVVVQSADIRNSEERVLPNALSIVVSSNLTVSEFEDCMIAGDET